MKNNPTPNLDEQIREIVRQIYCDGIAENQSRYETRVQSILSLFRSLVPEGIDKEHQKELNKDDPDEHGKWWSLGWNSGFNTARQFMLDKLERRGK